MWWGPDDAPVLRHRSRSLDDVSRPCEKVVLNVGASSLLDNLLAESPDYKDPLKGFMLSAPYHRGRRPIYNPDDAVRRSAAAAVVPLTKCASAPATCFADRIARGDYGDSGLEDRPQSVEPTPEERMWTCRGCGTTDRSKLSTGSDSSMSCEVCGTVESNFSMIAGSRQKNCARDDDKTTVADEPCRDEHEIAGLALVNGDETCADRRKRHLHASTGTRVSRAVARKYDLSAAQARIDAEVVREARARVVRTVHSNRAKPHVPGHFHTHDPRVRTLPAHPRTHISPHVDMISTASQHIRGTSRSAQLISAHLSSVLATPVVPHRFFNATLKPVYDSCLLPVKPGSALPGPQCAVESTYAKCDDLRSGFRQRARQPPVQLQGKPRSELSRPFAPPPSPDAFDSDEDGGGEAGESSDEPQRKKRRKRVLVGQLRCYRVRMMPTAEQRHELKRCFGAARHAYNWFVDQVENQDKKPNEYALKKAYRARDDHPTWAEPVSSRIRAGGINDAANAYKSNFEKRKKNPSHTFDVKYRSHRKSHTEVVHVDGDGEGPGKQSPLLAFKPLPFANPSTRRAECAAFFGSNLSGVGVEEQRAAESDADRRARLALNAQLKSIGERPVPKPKAGAWRDGGADGIRLQDKPHVIARLLAEGRGGNGDGVVNGCKIHWDKRKDTFHLLYCYELPPAAPDPDPRFETKRIAATDPGARSFQTWYSPTSGDHGELLAGCRERLERRCARLDALQSAVATLRAEHVANDPAHRRRTPRQRGRRLKRLKRQEARERCRLRNWVGAGHYAAANFLLRAHDLIVAPHLKVAEMVPSAGRVFGSKTARAMLTWSHGRFTQRLHSAAYRHSGRTVLSDVGEPGTSKTCGSCGRWHADLGGSKTFQCPKCGVAMDRDVNGARNNFLAAYGRARGIGWDRKQH